MSLPSVAEWPYEAGTYGHGRRVETAVGPAAYGGNVELAPEGPLTAYDADYGATNVTRSSSNTPPLNTTRTTTDLPGPPLHKWH
jgi:hypothetical protein